MNEEYSRTSTVLTSIVCVLVIFGLMGYAVFSGREAAIQAREQTYEIKTSSSIFVGKNLITYRESVTFFNVETNENMIVKDAQISYKPIEYKTK